MMVARLRATTNRVSTIDERFTLVKKRSLPAWRYPFRGRRRMLKTLGSDLGSTTKWRAVNIATRGESAGGFSDNRSVQELARYLPLYETVIDQSTPIRMLEIGRFYGSRLERWRQLLHCDSLVVGADPKSKLLKIADSNGIHVQFGADYGAPFLNNIAAEFGPFDVIIDAGNHTSSHMVDAFRSLFTKALTDSGFYIVEAVSCDYWKSQRDSRISFIDLLRALIDAMHAPYQVTSGVTNFQIGHEDLIREVEVPAITPVLGGIEIYDSLVIVRRAVRNLAQSMYRL